MKSPRLFIALAGVLALVGVARAGTPDVSLLLLPLAFGQEPVPSARPAQEPELLPAPKPVGSPAASKPSNVSIPDGGTVLIGGWSFLAHPCTGEAPCCAKCGTGCSSCAKPAVGIPADACDNFCLASAKAIALSTRLSSHEI